jgi:hypothetical protein
VQHIQRHGILLTGAQVEPLRELAGQPTLDPAIKIPLAVLLGSLRPGDRLTGERLREFRPPLVPVIPPPPPPKE